MPGGFGKGSKNPKSKREYKKWGGHPGTGQPKKIENSKGQKVGLKGLNAEEMSGYNRDRYLEFKERANRPPAPKKTKEEEDQDRALRLARHEERKGRKGVRESVLAAEANKKRITTEGEDEPVQGGSKAVEKDDGSSSKLTEVKRKDPRKGKENPPTRMTVELKPSTTWRMEATEKKILSYAALVHLGQGRVKQGMISH